MLDKYGKPCPFSDETWNKEAEPFAKYLMKHKKFSYKEKTDPEAFDEAILQDAWNYLCWKEEDKSLTPELYFDMTQEYVN